MCDVEEYVALGVLVFIEDLARKILFFCLPEHTRDQVLVPLFSICFKSWSSSAYIVFRGMTLTRGAWLSVIFDRQYTCRADSIAMNTSLLFRMAMCVAVCAFLRQGSASMKCDRARLGS
jgi:predicted ATP-grasp superfamily ATP-dependent carboligase